MSVPLNVLLVEDVEDDALLIVRELRRGGYEPSFKRVDGAEAFVTSLNSQIWDIVLADYKMPSFNGSRALEILRERDPDLPFIVVSGQIGEETAVSLMKAGAQDYVMKDNLNRLVPAIQREISEANIRRARKMAEDHLQANAELFRTLTSVAPVGIFMIALDGEMLFVNDRYCQIAGLSEGSPTNDWIAALHPDDRDEVLSQFKEAVRADNSYSLKHRFVHSEGTVRWVLAEALGVKNGIGETTSYIGTITDITELKIHEESLRKVNREFATLSRCNEQIIRAENVQDLLVEACKIITRVGGYSYAWTDLIDNAAGNSSNHLASQDTKRDLLEAQQSARPLQCNPVANAIIERKTQLVKDVGAVKHSGQGDFIAPNENGSLLSIPLCDTTGDAIGTLTVCDKSKDAFSRQDIKLLEELAGDLSFGIRAIHLRSERNQAQTEALQYQRKLRQSLEDALRALATTAELRDPFTGGHQQRVGELASRIALKMNLPDEKIHSIYLAGVVHDIGKIQVPAEILAKPTRLTEIEFAFVKNHPQAGYDILKGVDFPWPIADIVWQHHERLDGSGYPRGLTEKDILLETKIISVADVVEAISSHRPYRASLGIDAALAEVSRGRGTLYDAEVVDICLSLMREEDFQFSSNPFNSSK